MTKQDIHDIIQLLESHFESIGKEVRDELTFSFIEEDMHFVRYDSSDLFVQFDENDNEYQADSIKSHLKIMYDNPFTCEPNYSKTVVDYGSRGAINELKNVAEILETDIKNDEFHLKTYHYLTQEFKVVGLSKNDYEIELIILDTEPHTPARWTSEKIELKKFNQL